MGQNRAESFVHFQKPPADTAKVASILSLIYSLLAFGARITVKWELLFYDDAVLGVAYVRRPTHISSCTREPSGLLTTIAGFRTRSLRSHLLVYLSGSRCIHCHRLARQYGNGSTCEDANHHAP